MNHEGCEFVIKASDAPSPLSDHVQDIRTSWLHGYHSIADKCSPAGVCRGRVTPEGLSLLPLAASGDLCCSCGGESAAGCSGESKLDITGRASKHS